MKEFYVILALSILYIAFMGGVIGYLIGKYWKKKQRMNKRKSKKLFYKESAKWLLKRGWTDGYISPNTIKYVVRKLEKLTKLKLIYYLHNKVEQDYFMIRVKK